MANIKKRIGWVEENKLRGRIADMAMDTRFAASQPQAAELIEPDAL